MRTWLVIYKENGEIKTMVIMAKHFDDVVYEVWDKINSENVKGIFEVAR